MTHNRKAIIAGVTAAALLTTGAVWAETMPTSNQANPQQSTINNDFGKLSKDGASAFRNVVLARVAIFDGRVDQAKKLVDAADQSFAKAQTDAAVYTKAEADLRPVKTAKKADAQPQAKSSVSDDQMKKPINWLPVDAKVSIDEDYKLSPTKTAAVVDADQSMKSGDRNSAMEKLKLAGINTDVVLGVVPLNQTISDVHQAAQLIDSGKFYEGSQMLRQIQNNEHFDIADYTTVPATADKSASNASTSTPAVPSTQTK